MDIDSLTAWHMAVYTKTTGMVTTGVNDMHAVHACEGKNSTSVCTTVSSSVS
jgi:hypothetical protein